jgi:hypothetical protein
MSTNTAVFEHGESQFFSPIVAAAALLAAAGALAIGATLAGDGDGEHSSDGRVHPGKVGVLGGAKVRTWSGQTFSLVVPLKWQKVLENPSTHTYAWAQPAPGATLSSAAAVNQAAGAWAEAKDVVRTRITVNVLPSASGRDAEASARSFARSDVNNTVGFLDLGPVSIGPTAWRFDVAVAGTIESHYFFSTCADGKRRESWQIVVDRAALHGREAGGQSRAVNAIFASLKTTFPGSRSSGPDCTS